MARPSTAVYGGSSCLLYDVVLPCMLGNTYPIIGSDRMVSEQLGNSGLADFVRLEFRPADQLSVMLSLRRHAVQERRRRAVGGLIRRFQSWRATTKASREAATAAH